MIFEQNPVYENCVLSFERHIAVPVHDAAVYEGERVWFNATAKCKNSQWTKFKFIVTCNNMKPFHNTECLVFQTSEIEHEKYENHRRHFKRKRRDLVGKDLLADPPCIKKFKMLDEVSEKTLKAGNLNNAPDRELLCKISSENNTKDDLDKDFTMCMWKMIKRYEETWNGDIFSGYAVKPFYIILMTDVILKHVHLARYKTLFLYVDATGTIIKNPPHVTGKVFMYYRYVFYYRVANIVVLLLLQNSYHLAME